MSERQQPHAPAKHRRKTTGWAALLVRTLDIDALKCPTPGCEGRTLMLAFLTDPRARITGADEPTHSSGQGGCRHGAAVDQSGPTTNDDRSDDHCDDTWLCDDDLRIDSCDGH